MSEIKPKMLEALKLIGKENGDLNYEARICMVNTLLGDNYHGTFEYEWDTRSEALQEAKDLAQYYDISYVENKQEKYFLFNTNFENSLYHGISAKLKWIE